MDREKRNGKSGQGSSGGENIPNEAREVIADVLLASSCKDGGYPTYNEEQMYRRYKRSSRAEEYFIALSLERSVLCGMIGEKAIDIPGLAQDERTAWEMFSAGCKTSEIAKCLRVSRPTAVRILRRSARFIADQRASLRGLNDVYCTEVHRHLYRKPAHCPEQPCRQLGYCKYPGQL